MAYQKKTSSLAKDKAQSRLDGLASIADDLDLGNGISVATLQAAVDLIDEKMSSYNQMLSNADAESDKFDAAETAANNLSERALDAVGVKYGKDSEEFMKAGGTKKSERKKPTAKVSKAAKG